MFHENQLFINHLFRSSAACVWRRLLKESNSNIIYSWFPIKANFFFTITLLVFIGFKTLKNSLKNRLVRRKRISAGMQTWWELNWNQQRIKWRKIFQSEWQIQCFRMACLIIIVLAVIPEPKIFSLRILCLSATATRSFVFMQVDEVKIHMEIPFSPQACFLLFSILILCLNYHKISSNPH